MMQRPSTGMLMNSQNKKKLEENVPPKNIKNLNIG